MTKRHLTTEISAGKTERDQLLQRIVDLELALSACVSMLGGEARITDHQVIAAADRPVAYLRDEAKATTVLRIEAP